MQLVNANGIASDTMNTYLFFRAGLGLGMAMMLAGAVQAAEPSSASTPKPGSFESLVLSLSWSPTWCASPSGKNDHEQCGGTQKYAFIAHGLWPEFPRGSHASHGCGGDTGLTDKSVEKVKDIMPSRKLVNHEWERHGTCMGGDAAGYFGKVRSAWDKIKIPAQFKAPSKDATLSTAAIRKAFTDANPGLPGTSIAITCQRPRVRASAPDTPRPLLLKEVHICLEKDLGFKACSGSIKDRCDGDAVVGAVK